MAQTINCYCGARMVLKESRYGPFWSCSKWPDCTGKVGAHPDGSPLGTPADPRTAEARKAAHETFDEWWRSKGWNRGRAYAWLEANAQKPHIAEMTKEECEQLIELIEDEYGL